MHSSVNRSHSQQPRHGVASQNIQQQQPSMMGSPMMFNQPVGVPPMGQPGMGIGQPMGMGMHPGVAGQAPAMYGAQRMPLMGGYQQPRPPQQQQTGQSTNVNDPFGAL
uniref:Uncharacterized protein n=1 Tax=Arion vulgaris TaxID=1028688 RepID=A0A0B6XZW0_9EUPU